MNADRIACLVDERDRAREECGFEKKMRQAMRVELNMFVRLYGEQKSTLARVEALVRAAEGFHQFDGGWDDGIVSAAELAAVLGIEPSGPPPPLTEAEAAEMCTVIAEIRAEQANAKGTE